MLLSFQSLNLICGETILLFQLLDKRLVIERHLKPFGQFLADRSTTGTKFTVDCNYKNFVLFHLV